MGGTQIAGRCLMNNRASRMLSKWDISKNFIIFSLTSYNHLLMENANNTHHQLESNVTPTNPDGIVCTKCRERGAQCIPYKYADGSGRYAACWQCSVRKVGCPLRSKLKILDNSCYHVLKLRVVYRITRSKCCFALPSHSRKIRKTGLRGCWPCLNARG